MTTNPAAPLEPREVAAVLAQIGVLMEMNGRDPFRARAFTAAARALEGTDADLATLAAEDRLTELPGIGAAIAAVVREIVETGRSTPYEELATATPIGLFDLLRVPGLGPKRIHTIHQKLGVDSLDSLEVAARAGRLAKLPGIGPKTEARILAGVEFARSARGRRRYPEALEIAVRLLESLLARPDVLDAAIVGPLRRRMEVVDRIDLVAASDRPEAVRDAFAAFNGIVGVPRTDDEGALLAALGDGVPVRLRVVPPTEFVAAVVWDTGSDAHIQQLADHAARAGLEWKASGLYRGGEPIDLPDEEAFYTEIGLAYVPPESREGLDEVSAAAAGRTPRLVELEDLTGTFHCHTTYSDGKATLTEMAGAAAGFGWAYLGIADHSRTAAYARGLSVEQVMRQRAEVDDWNASRRTEPGRIRIFHGIESDILPDGELDYPDDVLDRFDYVIGSVHSSFRMSEDEMTERVARAIQHPALTILGHPTGRLLLRREGYAIDVDAVLAAAAETNTIIEINANPNRLDLDWRHVRKAARLGIIIAINPDAHSVAGLEHVAFGVNMARKAGLEPRQVLNCWSLDELEEYFGARKQTRSHRADA